MKPIFSAIALLIFLLGCQPSSSIDTGLLEQINEGLIKSNQQIRNNSSNILRSFYDKSTPGLAIRLKNVLPKAIEIKEATDSCLNYLWILSERHLINSTKDNESWKSFLKKEAVVERLEEQLSVYKRSVLNIQKGFTEIDTAYFSIRSKDVSELSMKARLNHFLSSSSRNEVYTFLLRLRNDLVLAENNLLESLYHRATCCTEDFTSFEAIVGQNAKVLEAGDELEITTGMGSFARQPVATVKINDTIVPLNEKGMVVYKIRTSHKSGNYKLPVTFSFTDQDGKLQTRTFTVEYKTVSALR